MANIFDAILSPLNQAGDLVKGLVEVRDLVKLGDLQVRLQGQIMAALQGATAAQSQQLTMGEEIRQLKDEIVQLENWEAEKKRYQLQQLPPGVFVYALKPGQENGEPPHCICERCYQQSKKSILHQDEQRNGIYHLTYNGCGTKLAIGHFVTPHVQTSYNPFER